MTGLPWLENRLFLQHEQNRGRSQHTEEVTIEMLPINEKQTNTGLLSYPPGGHKPGHLWFISQTREINCAGPTSLVLDCWSSEKCQGETGSEHLRILPAVGSVNCLWPSMDPIHYWPKHHLPLPPPFLSPLPPSRPLSLSPTKWK